MTLHMLRSEGLCSRGYCLGVLRQEGIEYNEDVNWFQYLMYTILVDLLGVA